MDTSKLPPLMEGSWTTSAHTAPEVRAMIEQAEDEWVGLALTTHGAVAVRRARGASLTATDGSEVDLGTVFELRLWAPDSKRARGVLAHEARWLNGSGGATTTVFDNPTAGEAPCWTRSNEYLQHNTRERPEGPLTMTAVEVFIEEPGYSNTVFVDEFFTGRWG